MVGESAPQRTHLGLAMAFTNILGSLIGTYLALRHGSTFVRRMFVTIVVFLILKSGYDAFLR
jgi:uncharacterized protein